jgi:hypothetical protein
MKRHASKQKEGSRGEEGSRMTPLLKTPEVRTSRDVKRYRKTGVDSANRVVGLEASEDPTVNDTIRVVNADEISTAPMRPFPSPFTPCRTTSLHHHHPPQLPRPA